MTDKREDILVRLLAVLEGVAGVRLAERNQENIPENVRPAIVLHDGGEMAHDDDPVRTRTAARPRHVSMSPDIVLLLGDVSEDVGTTVNTYRARILKAVQTDATLDGLTVDHGGIRYVGTETNLEAGRDTEAFLVVSFTFTYILRFDLL